MDDGQDRDAILANRLALLDHCRQTELRATTAQVAAVIAHMIGTPLNVIVGRAALVHSNPNAESTLDNVRRIEAQAQRLTMRIQRLLEYLDVPESRPEVRRACDVIADAVALYAPVARHYNRTLRLSRERMPETRVDGTPTLAILTALLSQAIRSSAKGETVRLDAEEATDPHAVVFALWVPGMNAVAGRIDGLDPPEQLDAEHVAPTQMLAVCAVNAERGGGSLHVVADEEGRGVTLRLRCVASPGFADLA